MKKRIIWICVFCLVMVVLPVAQWQYTLPSKMDRLCQSVYAQLQNAPAVRVQQQIKDVDIREVKRKETQRQGSTYWICGNDRLMLKNGMGELYFDGLHYEKSTKTPYWTICEGDVYIFWNNSWDALIEDRTISVKYGRDGLSVRYADDPKRSCVGWYAYDVIFYFDWHDKLTAVGFESINYTHAGVSEENISSVYSTIYQISSSDEEIVRQELEGYAQQILEVAKWTEIP